MLSPSRVRAVLFLLLTGLCRSLLSGQSYLVRTYTENDGLASSTIHDLLQTPDGRIWFATRSGLSVYDGSEWTSFAAPSGFPSLTVNKLALDAAGSLWALGDNPTPVLARFQGGRWRAMPRPRRIEESSGWDELAVVGPPGDETAYVGTRQRGVLVFRRGVWSRLGPADGLPAGRVLGLRSDGGLVYAAIEGGLAVLRDGRLDRSLASRYPPLGRTVAGLAVERAGAGTRIWLAGPDWLGRLTGDRFELLEKGLETGGDAIYPGLALCPDGTGGVFFGNEYTVFHWRASVRTVEKLDEESGLISEGTTALLLDREMNVWIAGLRGLSKIAGRRFANYRRGQGLLEDEVSAIVQAPDGRIIFGHNGGLSVYDGRAFRTIPFPARASRRPIGVRVLDLAVDAEGTIWAASSLGGLARIGRDGSIRFFGPEAGLIGQISSIARAPDGKMWVATNMGPVPFSGLRAGPPTAGAPRNQFMRRIIFTPDGRLVCATPSSGILGLDGGRWISYSSPDEPAANNVFALFDDGPDRLLVGTMAGLYLAKDGKLVPYAPTRLFLRRPVYLILRQRNGPFWFGTDNGVIRWDGRNARSFSVRHGLAGLEVNRAAGCVDAAGQVWIGTSTGVSRYQAEYDFRPDLIPAPLVRIEGLTAGGARVEGRGPLRLAARDNDLEFSFRAVSILDESAVRYRYRMDGYDTHWSPPRTGAQGLIRYTNLPPGRYRLEVRAANALDEWSRPVASPEISIAAPLVRRWWFLLLLTASLLLLTAGAFQLANEKRAARSLERQVFERTAQIRAALEEKNVLLREIHHRVKNNLQIVSSLLSLQARRVREPGLLALFRESQNRIRAMALIHENLYRSESAASISASDYIRRLSRELIATYAVGTDKAVLDLDVEDVILSPETAFPCGLIINELVSNALKHAFPGERRGRIGIGLRRAGREMVLSVTDDGVGLAEGIDAGRGGALGLRLVRNLAGQLGGALSVSGGAGTRFEIRFPAAEPGPEDA